MKKTCDLRSIPKSFGRLDVDDRRVRRRLERTRRRRRRSLKNENIRIVFFSSVGDPRDYYSIVVKIVEKKADCAEPTATGYLKICVPDTSIK